jgi:hypothetical protein
MNEMPGIFGTRRNKRLPNVSNVYCGSQRRFSAHSTKSALAPIATAHREITPVPDEPEADTIATLGV